MEFLAKILKVVLIHLCFIIIHCNGVPITFGTINEIHILNGNSLLIECILNSGNVDHTTPRSWALNGTTLISDGILSTAGSGYNEIVGTDRFSLSTPMLDYSFDAAIFRCNYGFFRAILISKIYDIGNTDQSQGDCIDGKSIDNCWFSLSKVFPAVCTQIVNVTYDDDTEENINNRLIMTSQFNSDGKTRSYYIKILLSTSKNVKAITLTFTVGPISRTLSIEPNEGSDYSDGELFLRGFCCFLIVLSASIIILLIMWKVPERVGGLRRKRILIITSFMLIALVVGLCLGLFLKKCHQRNLSLYLGSFLGSGLAIALVLAIYVCR